MPGIPPAPTQSQFEQVARVIDPNARVISTWKLAGGISSRMDVVELGPVSGGTRKVIVRQYYEEEVPPDIPKSRVEPATLLTLTANHVPAPEVIIGEEAGEILGRPAIVISYLDGVPGLIPADPQDWAHQLARAIAQVHTAEVPDELKAMLRPAHESVQKWMDASELPRRFARHELGPELWEAMRQLWTTVDTSARNLTHGDFWPGNTLWKDEKLLAIVDWDGPLLGEPTLDIGYFLSDTAYFGMEVEQTFLEAWERASGRPVQDLLFWKMAAAARAMPDPGPWAQGYAELGIRTMNADEIRLAHSNFVRSLLS